MQALDHEPAQAQQTLRPIPVELPPSASTNRGLRGCAHQGRDPSGRDLKGATNRSPLVHVERGARRHHRVAEH